MTAFPVPPPLKSKPLPPKTPNHQIPHPERVMRIVLLSGVMGMVFALVCGGIFFFLLNPFFIQWQIPPVAILIVFGLLGWTGFHGGVRSGQRVISQILHADHAK